MKNLLIGRTEEQKTLQRAMDSSEAEMVAVIGRRRVGKTFLIKSFYQESIVFEITGAQNASPSEQMQLFIRALNAVAQNTIPLPIPKDWFEAFHLLTLFLTKKMGHQKKVVFFDELPWLAAQKSNFISALGYFWNSWAVNQNIIVVICGSAASWMIKNIVNNTGGLYNRITKRIFLQPFDLRETELYLQSRNIHFPRYHIIQLYMTFGGIPHYLKEVEANKSIMQNINQLCFSQNALLKDEFSRLYPALFKYADNHISLVRALVSKRMGMTRQEIVKSSQLPNGGGLTKVLEELKQSGFISSYWPFGKKKKETIYRLTDEFSLFYLQFMEQNNFEDEDSWNLLSQTQAYKIWSGYAFENICLKHIKQIKKALGISGVYSQSSSFYKKGTQEEKGIQIDLLIDRNDQVINLCEIKFYHEPFTISKEYAANLRNKMGIFRSTTKTRKHLMTTMITTYGLTPNVYGLEMIPYAVTLEDLFE